MRVVLWRLAAGVRRPPLVYGQSQRHSAALTGCRPLRHRSMAAAAQSSADPAPALDRDAFTEVLRLQALRVPARDCQRFMRLMTGCEAPKQYNHLLCTGKAGCVSLPCALLTIALASAQQRFESCALPGALS